jgi:hypothetical protein
MLVSPDSEAQICKVPYTPQLSQAQAERAAEKAGEESANFWNNTLGAITTTGFTEDQAYRALAATRYDVDLAIERLMAYPPQQGGMPLQVHSPQQQGMPLRQGYPPQLSQAQAELRAAEDAAPAKTMKPKSARLAAAEKERQAAVSQDQAERREAKEVAQAKTTKLKSARQALIRKLLSQAVPTVPSEVPAAPPKPPAAAPPAAKPKGGSGGLFGDDDDGDGDGGLFGRPKPTPHPYQVFRAPKAPKAPKLPPRPAQQIVCDAEETAVVGNAFKIFAKTPGLVVKRVVRNDNEAQYRIYKDMREMIKEQNGGDPNEVWLFNGNDSMQENIKNGFMTQYASEVYNAYGVGIYFAADPRLSMYFERKTRDQGMGVTKTILLARVTLGKMGVRAHVPPENLTKPESKLPTPGCHSNTSQANIEAIVYENHRAFPAYLIEYESPPARDPYAPSLNGQLRKICDAEGRDKQPTLQRSKIIRWDNLTA